MKKLLIPCVALLLVLSCSKMSTPTEPVLGTGKLIATVTDAASHAGIANVTVEVRHSETSPVFMTGMTNASGVSELTVPAGSYWVRIVPPAGYGFAGGRADLAGAQVPIDAGGTAAVTVPLSRL